MSENKVPWFDKSNGDVKDRVDFFRSYINRDIRYEVFPHIEELLEAYDLKCAQLEAVEKAEEVYIKSKSA